METIITSILFYFLAMLIACGSSWARGRNCATAVNKATAVTTDPLRSELSGKNKAIHITDTAGQEGTRTNDSTWES